MLRFKETGIQRYDWGGLFEDESTPERARINNFKRDFGGQQERIYDCTVPMTLRGRIYIPLRDAWRRRKLGSHWADPGFPATAVRHETCQNADQAPGRA